MSKNKEKENRNRFAGPPCTGNVAEASASSSRVDTFTSCYPSIRASSINGTIYARIYIDNTVCERNESETSTSTRLSSKITFSGFPRGCGVSPVLRPFLPSFLTTGCTVATGPRCRSSFCRARATP